MAHQNKIAIVGGGAAGFFAAITCAEADPSKEIAIYERGSQFLTKVRISGGGRCNVTHACFDPRQLSSQYPRGERALIAAFHRFSATDTIAWFEARGVKIKTEADGRMFPITDSSETVVECLLSAARQAGVRLLTRQHIEAVAKRGDGGFELQSGKETVSCDCLLLSTGGCRNVGSGQMLEALGHHPVSPVPSLFSFHVGAPWLRSLAGISLGQVEVSVPKMHLREHGPILITHNGVSGPVILRLSAWGARILHELDYRFVIRINWAPNLAEEELRLQLNSQREVHPNRRILNTPLHVPGRLWQELAQQAEITPEIPWGRLSRQQSHRLASLLHQTDLEVDGKSLNKEEFVTCGGVNLREVDFKTMQSRITPGLYFAGEILDIDGITGGFNFQAAWTTGWIAGNAMAKG